MTLSNVADWSEENAQPSSQPQLLQDINDDEDDGKRETERERANLALITLPYTMPHHNYLYINSANFTNFVTTHKSKLL